MKKRFYLFALIPFVFGILNAYYFDPSNSLVFGLLTATVITGIVCWNYTENKSYIEIVFAVFCLLTGTIGLNMETQDSSTFKSFLKSNDEFVDNVQIDGKLYKYPVFSDKVVYLFIRTAEINEQQRTANLRLKIRGKPEIVAKKDLSKCSEISVYGSIYLPENFHNPGAFDYRNYLKRKDIDALATTKSGYFVDKKKEASLHFRILSDVRNYLSESVSGSFSEKSEAFLQAILLGNRKYLSNDRERTLQKGGIYHIIAISGLHIGIITFLLYQILKLFTLSERFRCIFSILVLAGFLSILNPRPSVIRATVITVVYLTGRLLFRETNLVNVLSFSALLILIFNPLELFNPGFLLTFSATYSIVLFSPLVMKVIPDIPYGISELISASLTAQLGVFPLIVFFFNRVSGAFIISNLIAVPLVGILMLTLAFYLPLIQFIPFLSDLISAMMDFNIEMIYDTAGVASSLIPSYRVPSSPLYIILIYYFLLLLILKVDRKRYAWICFGAVFLVIAAYPIPEPVSENLKVTVIDVKQGESILVEFPEGSQMLIDGGGFHDSSFDIGENVVSPFLWSKGIRDIEYMVLSHPHRDHIKGLYSIMENFDIGQIWMSEVFRKDKHTRDFVEKAKGRNIPVHYLEGGYQTNIGDSAIVIPGPGSGDGFVKDFLNNNSMVLSLKSGGRSILFTGDIEREAERSLLNSRIGINHDVLKIPHHGSSSSFDKRFLKAVSPEVSVISVGKNNRFNMPSREVLEFLKNQGSHIKRTDRDGAVEITLKDRCIKIREWKKH